MLAPKGFTDEHVFLAARVVTPLVTKLRTARQRLEDMKEDTTYFDEDSAYLLTLACRGLVDIDKVLLTDYIRCIGAFCAKQAKNNRDYYTFFNK